MNTSELLSPQRMRETFSPFVQHLLGMEPRIRVYEFLDDLVERKGYIPTKTGIYMPCALPSIEHEIAHFVEMEDKNRWTKTDWGLGVSPNFPETATVPHLIVAAARETRVRAIQYQINNNYNPYLFNNSYWQDNMERRVVGTGRFKSPKDISNWLWGMSIRAQGDWDLDRIESAWKERIAHLQNWMETK